MKKQFYIVKILMPTVILKSLLAITLSFALALVYMRAEFFENLNVSIIIGFLLFSVLYTLGTAVVWIMEMISTISNYYDETH